MNQIIENKSASPQDIFEALERVLETQRHQAAIIKQCVEQINALQEVVRGQHAQINKLGELFSAQQIVLEALVPEAAKDTAPIH